MIIVFVFEGRPEQAMRVLKRRLVSEGTLRECKRHREYEKPSEKRKRKKAESAKRLRKAQAKAESGGFG